ncbi:hypothetical protein CY34DRAFT_18713 [Suillus luteus UH-Slu-Lm8-n1]|uniref:Uncharacterized protein n=1 Tax=Suillus luteus UH-Slu-Lm8-n1 TaxID=930992 RepID=A0A0D0ALX9_9AGAM|nr:hypothetical protein CY34DRAFT_18713 [Suillus luteus UH-Slu-Lm8-n1]
MPVRKPFPMRVHVDRELSKPSNTGSETLRLTAGGAPGTSLVHASPVDPTDDIEVVRLENSEDCSVDGADPESLSDSITGLDDHRSSAKPPRSYKAFKGLTRPYKPSARRCKASSPMNGNTPVEKGATRLGDLRVDARLARLLKASRGYMVFKGHTR